ncbi:hypothetical protein ACFX2J_033068 [Malus domestica]
MWKVCRATSATPGVFKLFSLISMDRKTSGSAGDGGLVMNSEPHKKSDREGESQHISSTVVPSRPPLKKNAERKIRDSKTFSKIATTSFQIHAPCCLQHSVTRKRRRSSTSSALLLPLKKIAEIPNFF